MVANPPFLGQLGGSTTVSRERAAALRRRYGEAVQAYTDPAGLFLLRAAELASPAGRVAIVLPQSLLGARDAAGVRDAIGRDAAIVDLWVPADRFAAGIDVCLVVLELGGGGAAGEWSAALAAGLGVPPVDLRSEPTVAARAEVAASFRQEYYGLLPGLAERADAPGGRTIVTTGRIDLGGLRSRPVRLGRRTWVDPVVELEHADDAGRRWIERTATPKVLVATQTKVLEVVVDETGALVPVTPVIVVLAPSEDLWALAAAVASPPVCAWAFARVAGTALSAGALRLTAPLVRAIPLPVDDGAWADGTDALRAGDLDRFGPAMLAAYRAPPAVLGWWRPRAEPVWSPPG